jgi:tripartite-type tricarboxylate transporter receptor subunit TctC
VAHQADYLCRPVRRRRHHGRALGTSFVIENKPGAGGGLGTTYVAKARPDGYTIVGGTISSHAINVSLYSKLAYDPVKDFQPVAMLGSIPNILVVRADSPFKTVQDVIAAAKAKPGSINYASSGTGTSQHLSGVFFEQMTATKLSHIPYKGSAESLTALIGGQGADLIFENLPSALPYIKSGRLRAIAVTTAKRTSTLPDVPAIAETLPGFDVMSWQAIFAPTGVSKPIVDKLSGALAKSILNPEMKSKLISMGIEPSAMTPAELATFQKAEVAKWAKVIKTADIKLD